MLQYSHRRYMSGYFQDGATTYLKDAEDTQYSGRRYQFYESPNGHVMLLYFDRCLLRDLQLLSGLNVRSWIVDGRGRSIEYWQLGLRTYSAAAQNRLSAGEISGRIDALQALSGRPQRPGFFKANLTDQDREMISDSGTIIGEIKAVSKPRYLIMESKMDGHLPQIVRAIDSNGVAQNIEIENPLDILSNQPVHRVVPGQLIRLNYHGKISRKTLLCRL